MPRKGRTRKKTRTHTVDDEAAASAIASNHELKIPRSLVVRNFVITHRSFFMCWYDELYFLNHRSVEERSSLRLLIWCRTFESL